jgi:hypothetical protein
VDFQQSESGQQKTARLNSQYTEVKKKGKAIPLQAWAGPEGSRRLRLPEFKTIGT